MDTESSGRLWHIYTRIYVGTVEMFCTCEPTPSYTSSVVWCSRNTRSNAIFDETFLTPFLVMVIVPSSSIFQTGLKTSPRRTSRSTRGRTLIHTSTLACFGSFVEDIPVLDLAARLVTGASTFDALELDVCNRSARYIGSGVIDAVAAFKPAIASAYVCTFNLSTYSDAGPRLFVPARGMTCDTDVGCVKIAHTTRDVHCED